MVLLKKTAKLGIKHQSINLYIFFNFLLQYLLITHYYSYPKPLPILKGTLEKNSILQKATRLFEGKIVGPESFAVNKNGNDFHLYASFGFSSFGSPGLTAKKFMSSTSFILIHVL